MSEPPSSRSFLAEWAWLGTSGAEVHPDVLIEVTGDRISAVRTGAGATAPGAAVRLRGLTMPGFANAHSHAFHRALRGRTHAASGSFWSWREQMYAVAARLDPDMSFALARATFAEMALAGFTCVGEFHYLHHAPGGVPYADQNAMGAAVLAAAHEAGIRVTLLDAMYLRGGLDNDGGVLPLDAIQQRFSDGTAEAWAERVDALAGGTHARIGAAVHSVRAVSRDGLDTVRAWAADRGAVVHVHVSEQPAENEQCAARYATTPTGLLARHGLAGEHVTAVHATHLSADDIATLGRSASTCCFCPTTERDLADGIGPSAALVDAGARLAIGSDSQAVIDPLQEARAIELDHRLASGRRGAHPPHALASIATRHGHAALGWPDAGRIETGALADLTTIGLDSVRLRGTTPDQALAAVVFAGTAADVRHTIVGGDWIVRDGTHRSLDVGAELSAAITTALGV